MNTDRKGPDASELSAAKQQLLKKLLGATAAKQSAPAIPRVSEHGPCRLSFAQQRLWFLQQLDPSSSIYTIVRAYRLAGSLDESALRKSVQALMRRHEGLRTTFQLIQTGPVQVVAEDMELPFTQVDLRRVGAELRESALAELVQEQFRKPFTLSTGPLARFTLACIDEQEHVFIVCIHHIVTDDWSLNIFFRELSSFYNAFCCGRSPVLAEQPGRYTDFALAEQEFVGTAEFEAQLSYWKQQLADSSSTLNLPVKARPAVRTDAATSVSIHLARDLGDRMDEFCRQEKSTRFVFLLAVFATLLARFTDDYDLSIGTIVSGRDRKALEQVFGFITNTVVLRLKDLDSNVSFRQLLRAVKEILIEAHQNKDLPFEHLVRTLPSARNNVHAPLFQAMAFLQNTYEEHFAFNGIQAELVPVNNPVTAFDLSLALEPSARGLKVAFQYKTDVLKEDTATRLISDYGKVLEWVLQWPDEKISAISLLTQQEFEQLTRWNDTAGACLPLQQYAHQLFEQQVKRTPDATAVSCAGHSLTYRELNARANQLARYLRDLGVGPEKLVGICMERGPDSILSLLAVLKAGSGYLPLDPAHPVQRLQFMAEDAGFPVLLTHKKFAGTLANRALAEIQLDGDWQSLATYDSHDLDLQLDPAIPAYVIYTSGTTGVPKGVVVSHSALTNQLLWLKSEFPLAGTDRVLQRTALSFDAAVGEIFLALITGAQLIIADLGQSQDVDYLLDLIVKKRITLADVPPSLLMALLQRPAAPQCSSLRWVMCGGEMFPLELRERFSRTLNAAIYNLYGPTETTIQSTFHQCSAAETYGCVPIGQPIANTRVYVLDRAMELLPLEVAGELYIGGIGLARGYLNRPDLTARHFLPDPFSREPGARLFRTGDRVRWIANGKLEYLGRSDNQIKIRGYRIELGEIEAALQAHPRIQQAVVMLREDKPQQKTLAAYVVASGDGLVDTEELRRYLKAQLPEYMVPWHFVLLERLPLTPTGKIDRHGLPAPELRTKQYSGPRTAAEEILCGVFGEVLSLKQVGIDENFFALGGHSLLATQLVSRVRTALGMELPLRAVFESPTVAELVLHLQSAGNARIPLLPQQRGEHVPLSYAQQRLWFIDQMEGTSAEYNMPEALRLRGPLNLAALRSTIHTIVQRHEALRTHFVQVDSEPVQVIEPQLQLDLPMEDLSSLDTVSQERLIQEALRSEWQRPFDLSRGPLLRFRVLKLSERDHVLLRTFHHIISDGWSHGVFSSEFMVLYDAYCEGRENPLSPLPVQYADFTLWQRRWLREEVLVRQLDYWKKQLSGIPNELRLPMDRPRPSRQTFEAHRLRIRLPEERSVALRQLAQSNDATLYMTMIAAFAVLLQRYTGEQDIVIGSPIANRQEAALERLIGFFVNSIVIRTQVDPKLTFRDLLAQLRVTTLEAYAHQDLPFERLVAELSPERSLNMTPVYQVVFALQNAPLQAQQLKGLVTEPVRIDELHVRFDLELHVLDQEGTLELWWIYNRDLFEPWRIEQMAGHYSTLLDAFIENAGKPVSSVRILDLEQRRTILESFNAIRSPISQLTVMEMFARQAAATPDTPAVVCGTERLSYRELDRRAAALSNQLLKRGAGAEARIGLCVKRSVEMVVGILGILKSGAAYVPLDPDYPLERLRYIVEDSGVKLVVASRSQLSLVEQTGADALLLNCDPPLMEQATASSPVLSLMQLAYVIYTSGSTGKPKGVGVSHSNLLQSTQARWHTYECQPVKYLLLSSFAFDSSVAGIFWVLGRGGALHIPAKGMHNDVQALAALIEQNEITHLLCLPTFYGQLLEEGGAYMLRSLQVAIVAGETCQPELVEKHSTLLPGSRLYNEYGPTEATVWCTVHRFEPGIRLWRAPIGRPIPNVQIYVLDSQMEPVPLGVAGEVYIGGPGVARGYLNRPELTAERFQPDPFAAEGARLYRTGDMGRWRPDGELEFLGRNDQQVKIRGYRIEPEEIEALLRSHERVQDALVIVREQAGQLQLLGYAIPRNDKKESARQQALQVEQWKQLYDSIYQQAAHPGDFNIVGWTSSYTGLPIPPDEMRIWVEETAIRLRGLCPVNVLEIGCGTGLLLTRLAPHTQSYIGIDFSAEALGQVGSYLAGRGDMQHVVLRQGSADDLSFLADDSIDLVVLNSVIQYFPTVDYLLQTLSEACRVTRSGGHIFVGDVRSLPLAPAYYTSVQLHKAAPEMPLEELRQNIALAKQHEKELLVDPALFTELAARWQRLGHAETTLKPGSYDNELSRFRLDVMLSVGRKKSLVQPEHWIQWDSNGNWRRAMGQRLRNEPDRPLGLSGIPDQRVAAAVEAVRVLENPSADLKTAEQVRLVIQNTPGEDPASVMELAQQLGVALAWQGFGTDGSYHAIFNPQWREAEAHDDIAPSYYRRFVNSPAQIVAQAELSGTLLDFLRQHLPEYMVPGTVTILSSWPLTATGKIDRSALPSPDRRKQEYSVPETSLEESLAEIWGEALQISRVGRDDNFFDLGGHSLLIPRVRFMIREKLQRDVPIVDFFAFPTVQSMAGSMEGKHQPTTISDSERRALQQREFLLQQMRPARGLELQKEEVS